MRKQTKLVAALSVTALFAVGASMTSFAKGWTDLGDEEWVYLDSDGERVTQEWKRSGSEYYWLDEDGNLAKSQLVDDGENIYYVTSTGARLKNDWAMVENEDNIDVNGDEVSVLYYYFGANGKAYRADNDGQNNFKKKTISYGGKNRNFFFDADGHMASGWIVYMDGDTENVYYCGTELEGYAYTGWWQLEPRESEVNREYDDIEWFNFNDSGKMRKDTTWYSNGWYYTFNEDGVMETDWYDVDIKIATNTNAIATGTQTKGAFTTSVGTKGTGWVYTEDQDEDEYHWYYLVAFKDDDGIIRNIPFNSVSTDTKKRAKVISGKTYLFDTDGIMQTGVVHVTAEDTIVNIYKKDDEGKLVKDDKGNLIIINKDDDYQGGAVCRKLDEGYYYFNDGARSVKGQMLTGKQAYTKDGETSYYYFEKNGKAVTNQVKDGVVYGADGKRVQADDGNANMLYEVQDWLMYKNEWIEPGSTVVVSSTGKLRTSVNSKVRVDGVQYIIKKTDTSKDGYTAYKWEAVAQAN